MFDISISGQYLDLTPTACLVANRNSNILMENVGNYNEKWM